MDEALRREVGQLLWVGFEGVELERELERRLAEGRAGGAVLFRRNLVTTGSGPDEGFDVDAVCRLNASLLAAGPEPILISVDQEGGVVQRLRAPATRWPPMHGLAGLPDGEAASLARAVGHQLGRELASLGFAIDFAPVLDVHTNPANPIIGHRAFADQPEAVALRALALAAGLADAGVHACGKHFPGHGDTRSDSHLELPRLDHDLARLRAIELLPFARAARAGVPLIMTAHVVFAALDPAVPATLSRRVITELLRDELGFAGVIVSDDLDMKAIAAHFGIGEAAVAAIEAGCDVLLLCREPGHQDAAFEALVRAGEARPALRTRIAEAARRVRGLRARGLPRPDPAAARAVLGGGAELAARFRP